MQEKLKEYLRVEFGDGAEEVTHSPKITLEKLNLLDKLSGGIGPDSLKFYKENINTNLQACLSKYGVSRCTFDFLGNLQIHTSYLFPSKSIENEYMYFLDYRGSEKGGGRSVSFNILNMEIVLKNGINVFPILIGLPDGEPFKVWAGNHTVLSQYFGIRFENKTDARYFIKTLTTLKQVSERHIKSLVWRAK